MKNHILDDDIYSCYSLTRDLKISPEDEVKALEDFLKFFNLDYDVENTKRLGEIINDSLSLIHSPEFEDALEELSQISSEIVYIGSSIPLDLATAKELVAVILAVADAVGKIGIASWGIKKFGDLFAKDIYEKVKEKFLGGKNNNQLEEKKVLRLYQEAERVVRTEEGKELVEKISFLYELTRPESTSDDTKKR
ncbi:hypothetical protein CEE45_05210 [Candidatus Heimdallarchaeota archaeon B3_Heim]|nr:MAG: hypothetical protein CEE45_05210 [Candidatus Heimdallarchaeota archaeon B3_Heim]